MIVEIGDAKYWRDRFLYMQELYKRSAEANEKLRQALDKSKRRNEMNYQHQCPTCHLPIPHDGVDAALPLCPNCWATHGAVRSPKSVESTKTYLGSTPHPRSLSEVIRRTLEWVSDYPRTVDSGSGVTKEGAADDFWVKFNGKEYYVTVRESNRQRDLNKGEVK